MRTREAGLSGAGLLCPTAPRSQGRVALEHLLSPTRWHLKPCYGVPVPQPHSLSCPCTLSLPRQSPQFWMESTAQVFSKCSQVLSTGSWCGTRGTCPPSNWCFLQVVPETCGTPDPAMLGVVALHVSHWELVHCRCPGVSQCNTCPAGCHCIALVPLTVTSSGTSHWELLLCTFPAGSWCIRRALLGFSVFCSYLCGS